MRKYRFAGWALKLVGLYALLVLLYFGFAVASTKFDNVAWIESRINPATFVFWENGGLYRNPPLFSETMEDVDGVLSAKDVKDADEVDTWVLLLDGFEDIRNVNVASYLGINTSKVADSEAASTTIIKRTSVRLRAHLVPVVVVRDLVVIVDARHLFETYNRDCLDDILYKEMTGQPSKQVRDNCKL